MTLATYVFFIFTVIGRQKIDTMKKGEYMRSGRMPMDIDLYIPVYTVLQFFFYMGLLKVLSKIPIFSRNFCQVTVLKFLLFSWQGRRTTHQSIRRWRWRLRAQLAGWPAHEGKPVTCHYHELFKFQSNLFRTSLKKNFISIIKIEI